MLRFRPYKACDASAVVSWSGDERAFRQWSADRFAAYPITGKDLNDHYSAMAESDGFFEFTACDEAGPAGHLIMRFTDEEKRVVRFGFVIVDHKKRGRGYGREMLKMAVRYAFDFLKAEKITLGVFENNPSAYRCYRAVGFQEAAEEPMAIYPIGSEKWKCIELELKKDAAREASGGI